jgi:hypothetical protein
MDAWDTLKTGSILANGFDAWEYLESQGGTGETIYVTGIYSITYIGESEELITYMMQESIAVTYEDAAQITISYVGEEEQTIVYVAPDQINMEIVCN